MLDRGGEALRRVDELLQDTKEHVSDSPGRAQRFVPPQQLERHDWRGRRWSSRSGYARAERPAGRHSPGGGGVVLEEFPGALRKMPATLRPLTAELGRPRGPHRGGEQARGEAGKASPRRRRDHEREVGAVSPEAGRSDGSPRPKLPADNCL